MNDAVVIERRKKRIIVHWPEGPHWKADLRVMRTIPGRRWLKDEPGRPWSVPLDMTVCRLLRKGYGDRLEIGPDLRAWAYQTRQAEEHLGAISAAPSATLRRLPEALPHLYDALWYGPLGKRPDVTEGSYQTADVRFLADCTAPLNANHQGLGKTLEAIAEVWEAGRERGNHLVICPKGAIETVWEPELLRWQGGTDLDILVYPCVGNKAERWALLEEFAEDEADVKWVIVNPEMIRYEKDKTNSSNVVYRAKPKEYEDACKCARMVDAHWHYQTKFPYISNNLWNTIINDEVHIGNVRNQRALTAKSIYAMHLAPGGKLVAMSGTPMKKKGADMWGILHYLRPDVFTSYWNFADMFFHIEENDYGKTVGGLREDREEEFFNYLTPYVLRRTKDECLPWLPPKQHVDVWVNLDGKQLAQYQEMEEEGAAIISGKNVNATGILAQYTRLAQFANALCELNDEDVMPTRTSAKLDALWERLDEAGILDGSSEDKTVIFSQSERMISLVAGELFALGINVEMITGKKHSDRKRIVDDFQHGDLKVLCVVTSAGGVALTLDAADTAHFIDEMWEDDRQEQAEDRLHRASRNHQVTIYHYRARGTIDEDKMAAVLDKQDAHKHILDVRRRIIARRTGA